VARQAGVGCGAAAISCCCCPLLTIIIIIIIAACCRLPLEAESAALGAALQAAAVHSGVPVGLFVRQNQPPLADTVVQPNAAHKQAYGEALARHKARGAALFGGGGAQV
jgi:sugar (pentulose or hexulose) kinase